ncbi:unnamed protein product [Mytilus coruscus]|uniref:Farnesoic acid O-methyl transferase domain-containing protein n=1 Tax=Mytilus coruscus TaxID=42192 RepID=A0A6J8B6M9_MYTCO|nr:unnamed protein product [Mytilus coruscus]
MAKQLLLTGFVRQKTIGIAEEETNLNNEPPTKKSRPAVTLTDTPPVLSIQTEKKEKKKRLHTSFRFRIRCATEIDNSVIISAVSSFDSFAVRSVTWDRVRTASDDSMNELINMIESVDRYSNWPIVEISSNGAAGLITCLRRTFVTFGIPDKLASDGGLEFTSTATKQFLQDWGEYHRLSSVAFPHSNYRAKGGVKTVKRMIADNTGPKGDLDTDAFQRVMLQYRNTPDRDPKLSPAMETLDAREEVLRNRHIKQGERLSEHTKRLPPLATGDFVRIQNQIGHYPLKWDKTGVIIEVRQFDQYAVKVDGSGRGGIKTTKTIQDDLWCKNVPASSTFNTKQVPTPTSDTLVETPKTSTLEKRYPLGQATSDPKGSSTPGFTYSPDLPSERNVHILATPKTDLSLSENPRVGNTHPECRRLKILDETPLEEQGTQPTTHTPPLIISPTERTPQRYLEVRTFSGSQITKLKKLNEYYVSLSNHSFYPPQTKSLTFSLKASPFASILLSASVNLSSEDYYAIGIGVQHNLKFNLRKHVNSNWKTSSSSKNANNTILHRFLLRNFTIKWSYGKIQLVQDCNLNFEWTDDNPIQIKGIGIMTKSDGLWRFYSPGETTQNNQTSCGKGCGHCHGNDVCDRISGSCQGGCKHGWTGNKCDATLVSTRNTIAKTSSGSRAATASTGYHATTVSSGSRVATTSTGIHATSTSSGNRAVSKLSGNKITLIMPI